MGVASFHQDSRLFVSPCSARRIKTASLSGIDCGVRVSARQYSLLIDGTSRESDVGPTQAVLSRTDQRSSMRNVNWHSPMFMETIVLGKITETQTKEKGADILPRRQITIITDRCA
jgi:hypothetical protein